VPVGLDVEHLTWTTDGLKPLIERSKTDAEGKGAEIAIPCGRTGDPCPVAALKEWLARSEITAGPLFPKVSRVSPGRRSVTSARNQARAVRTAPLGWCRRQS
jgi:hypothetical protein